MQRPQRESALQENEQCLLSTYSYQALSKLFSLYLWLSAVVNWIIAPALHSPSTELDIRALCHVAWDQGESTSLAHWCGA